MPETQEKAREVAGQAQEKAREAAGQARGRVSQEVDRRSTQAGEQVTSNAGEVRSVAEELRKQGKDTPARNIDLREHGTGELFKELSDHATTLVRKEIELAKAELGEKGKKAGQGAGMFGGAGLFCVFAFGALTTCIIAALDSAMELWLAALIV